MIVKDNWDHLIDTVLELRRARWEEKQRPNTKRDIATGQLCIRLYRNSHSASQGQLHYVSVTDEWEWWFW